MKKKTKGVSYVSKNKAEKLSEGNAVDQNETIHKIQLPAGMSIPSAIDVLQKEYAYREQEVAIHEEIPGCLWDAAHCVFLAMKQKFGWVHGQPTVSLFSSSPPRMYDIPSGVGKTTSIPWGQFKVPGISGILTFISRPNNGRIGFGLQATVLRKHEQQIKELAKLAREIWLTNSLYRGKAIRVKFYDIEGEPEDMIIPQFMDVSMATEESLILNDRVQSAISTSLFTPIKYSTTCGKNGIPTKRGILLSGPFGTGKTLAAYVAARLCELAKRTFIYIEKANELEEAVKFAVDYQPSLVFCEDIDRVTSGERTIDTDTILNILDGIESKNSNVMVILTTNNAEAINQAMVRPGRLDDVITFTPPDASTVEKLIRYYAGNTLDDGAELSKVSVELNGQIPAVIRECVERSKLSQIKISNGIIEPGTLKITDAALSDAATSMVDQLNLLQRKTGGVNAYEALGRLLETVTARNGRADLNNLLFSLAAMPTSKQLQSGRDDS